ncbi:MAG TPA: hypothetical protein VK003_01665 [Oceanobacillus sp.]|nr:hypothetical protein [Oceanobacillus sp.]
MAHRLSRNVLVASSITATIDLVIGLAFLLGPEMGITLWPSPISPVLMRFIGSIILANGVGAALMVRQGTWEGARVLFMVALVYGVVILIALLYHLLFLEGTNPVFWGYVALDAVFLVPIAYIYWTQERVRS